MDKIYDTRNKVRTCSKIVIYFCLTYSGHPGLQIDINRN